MLSQGDARDLALHIWNGPRRAERERLKRIHEALKPPGLLDRVRTERLWGKNVALGDYEPTVAIPEDAVADTLAFMDRMPAGSTASMQRDIREGKPSELDAQVGAICRFGDAAGVRTPLHDVIYRTLSARG